MNDKLFFLFKKNRKNGISIPKKIINLSKNKILSNSIWLSIVQFINYALPFITIPFVIRAIGKENYGHTSAIIGLLNYLTLIVDYGHNFTATVAISKNKNNLQLTAESYSAFMNIRIYLLFFSFIFLFFIMETIQIDNYKRDLINYISVGLVGTAFFPFWLFQGLDKISLGAAIVSASRIASSILIILFVKEEKDIILYVFLNSLSTLLPAFISQIIIFSRFKIRLKIAPPKAVLTNVRAGWSGLLANIGSNLCATCPVIVFGLSGTTQYLANYTIAEKIIIGAKSLSGVIFQASFSHAIKLENDIHNSHWKRYILKYLLTVMPFVVMGSAVLFWMSSFIVRLCTGQPDPDVVSLVRLLLPMPIISFLSIPFLQYFMANTKNKFVAYGTWIGGATGVFLGLISVSRFQEFGGAVAALATEAGITITLLYCFFSKPKKIPAI